MRKAVLTSVSLFITAISFQISAQSFASFSDVSIVLRSDSSTKSVLMSDLLQNSIGDLSPIIGSASWTDKGKRLQCRSLLSFDYGMLPAMISPDYIINAELVLMPLQLKDQAGQNEVQPLKLTVRRVLQQWEDSTTNWLNQPLSNTGDEAIVRISRKKKDPATRINVTEMVKNMFRFGNNGFMLCYSDSLQTTTGSSHWFASTKYENENARPLLLISYSIPARRDYRDLPALPMTARDRDELLQMYVRPGPVEVTPPPPPPPPPPKGNQ